MCSTISSLAVKKASDGPTFHQIFEDEEILESLLSFFTLKEIFCKFIRLNKKIGDLTREANYLLLSKLVEDLNITSTYLTSELPAHEEIDSVYRQAVRDLEETKDADLKPQGFYTDSGLVGNNMWYGVHNIFDVNTSNMYGGYVFSSNKGSNNHLQFYISVPACGVDNPF